MRRPLYRRWEVKSVSATNDFGLSISEQPTIVSSASSTASRLDGKEDKDKKRREERKNEKVEGEGLTEKKGEVKPTETE
jgi:hypothetical protein